MPRYGIVELARRFNNPNIRMNAFCPYYVVIMPCWKGHRGPEQLRRSVRKAGTDLPNLTPGKVVSTQRGYVLDSLMRSLDPVSDLPPDAPDRRKVRNKCALQRSV